MKPDVPASHEDYDYKIIMRYHQLFGPFPWTFAQITDEDTLKALTWVMSETPPDSTKPFHLVSPKEIPEADKAFVLRALRLDPRDRPTATELLEDVWFNEI
jgi:serine/threonine protein kinase